MVDEPTTASRSGDYVEFVVAGQPAKGEYHCAECGYGVTIHTQLPPCPMCGGSAWEQTEWHPFTHGSALLH